MTYTEEQRDLNGRCSVVMGVEDYFATDANVARLLEDEIERRGLEEKYIQALYEILTPHINWALHSWDILWRCYRATPEQRARAFLNVTEPMH